MKKNNVLIFILVIIFSFFLLSCNKRTIKFGTGDINGNYNSYGKELANELNDELNIKISVETSKGSKANLDLVSKGFYDMAIVQSNDLADALSDGNTEGYHYSKSLFVEYFQIIVKDTSSIQDIYDLAGKNVSIGEEGSGISDLAKKVLSYALGDGYDEVNFYNLDFQTSAENLKDGKIDAMIIVSGSKTNAVKNIEETTNLRYIPLNEAVYNLLVVKDSGFIKTEIPANTLLNQTESIPTIGVYAVLVFNNSFDEKQEENIISYIEANNENIIDISFDTKVKQSGMIKITLNMFLTLLVGILALFLGIVLRKKVKFFDRFCIPAPVIGGLIFSLITLLLYVLKLIEFSFEDTIKDFFLMLFFAAVGFQANLKVIKKGGINLVKLTLCVLVLIFIQNFTAIGLGKLLKVDSLIALCTGSISMMGGHGTAGAFGIVLENMGLDSATTIATAAATFGLVAGSIMGAPLGSRLINKYKFKSNDDEQANVNIIEENNGEVSKTYAPAIYQLIIAMGIGAIIAYLLSLTKLTFPPHIGSMIVAAVMRNISEYFKKWKTPMHEINDIGNISLGLFLSITMIGLKLWHLAGLALPFIILLIGQIIICFVFARFVIFYVMGKNYDSAVIVAGACGFSMGATPNAMANMDSITSKHGPSIQAYLIVPIIGAMIIDIFNTIIISFFINVF